VVVADSRPAGTSQTGRTPGGSPPLGLRLGLKRKDDVAGMDTALALMMIAIGIAILLLVLVAAR
jgi:hypothetical protein